MTNEWTNPEHAQAYLNRLKDIPHRTEGEATLLSEVPTTSQRVLDLGCGNGHLLSLVLAHCPQATGVGLDFSPTMLQQARERFATNNRVTLVEHNMDAPLPDLGSFDCIVSSFAIHHCTHERKRELYAEAWSLLDPGGIFVNLEHVSSPNQHIHDRFVEAMGMTRDDEDPSNKLLDVEAQLQWLREIGFDDVDCHWKWRELALIAGRRPECRPPSIASMKCDDKPSMAEMSLLDEQLGAFNRQQTGRDDFKSLNVVMRDSNGKLIAGLKSVTGWDWLFVKALWVDEQHRRQGIGSQLLERAEHEARTRCCVGACLSSYDFQAPEFYRRHGYSVFGQIDEYPQGKTMYFLSKRFDERQKTRSCTR
jgi:SAM-dependent methyltransferase/N-acetylglutamate synthase-like GNAT family acetyltransferase